MQISIQTITDLNDFFQRIWKKGATTPWISALLVSCFFSLPACSNEVTIYDCDFELGEYEKPYFWRKAGDTQIPIWSDSSSVSGSRSLAVIDHSTDSYGEWLYDSIEIPKGFPGSDPLSFRWKELYKIESGQMRLTILFLDEDSDKTGILNFLVKDESPGWRNHEFTSQDKEIQIPEGTAKIRLYLVSGGPLTTVGSYFLDDFQVVWTRPEKEHREATESAASVIAYWDMEVADENYPDRPKGWEYSGNFPYLATWASNHGIAGSRAIKIEDADERSHGLWVSARSPLEDSPQFVDLSLFLKVKDLRGSWKISMNYYDMPVIHNYSQVKCRIDGLVRQTPEGLSIDWFKVTEESQEALGTDQYALPAPGGNDFLQIKRRMPVPNDTQCYRVALLSGWDPTNTGTIWVDEVSVAAVGKESGSQN